jgi:hypothetical protein
LRAVANGYRPHCFPRQILCRRSAVLLAPFAFVWHNIVARGPNKGDTWPA